MHSRREAFITGNSFRVVCRSLRPLVLVLSDAAIFMGKTDVGANDPGPGEINSSFDGSDAA